MVTILAEPVHYYNCLIPNNNVVSRTNIPTQDTENAKNVVKLQDMVNKFRFKRKRRLWREGGVGKTGQYYPPPGKII